MLNKDAIQCPHCNYCHGEFWEYTDPVAEEAEFKMECADCGKEFSVEMYTVVWFETSKLED